MTEEDGQSGPRLESARCRTDEVVAGSVDSVACDERSSEAVAALRRMAEAATHANRILAVDGSYTPDDAVCAGAATVAAVCEILNRLAPFLSQAWRATSADVLSRADGGVDREARPASHQVRIAFAGRDEVVNVAFD